MRLAKFLLAFTRKKRYHGNMCQRTCSFVK